MAENLILDTKKIEQKLNRIAYQIAEEHCNVKEIHLIGIAEGGVSVSKKLKGLLEHILPIEVQLHSLIIDKSSPVGKEIDLSVDKKVFKNKCVILIDDVCNSGKTLFYAYKPLLDVKLKSLKIAVLIDRKHKRFPIHCDYVGTSLSTTLKEHILVKFSNRGKIEGAFIN